MGLPSVAVTVPTWRRGEMFRTCVESLLTQDYTGHIEIMCVVDHDPGQSSDQMSDLNIAKHLQTCAVQGGWAGLRSVRIKRGPGRSNWRPGAIHFPVFEHWLQTKCDLVSYQFSDEFSGPGRIKEQVERLYKQSTCKWSYCRRVSILDGASISKGERVYEYNRRRVPCNQLMTPTIIVARNAFEIAGGLDYPLHAAAKAEEWIQTHCAILGDPTVAMSPDLYFFREHQDSLGHAQGPNSQTYRDATAETGWVEEDHWRLWNHIAPVYRERVERVHNG